MARTKFNPDEVSVRADIHYVSAIPGIGKTDGAINLMTKCLKEKETIFIYTAPTIRLLQEVEKRLLIDLGSRADKYTRRILPIHVKNRKYDDLSLVDEVMLRLDGGRHGGEICKRIKPGSIILLTHATFTALPLNLKGRSDMVVVFDEAYRCVFDPLRISMTNNDVMIFKKHIRTMQQGDYELLTGISSLAELKQDLPKLSAVAKEKLTEMVSLMKSGTSEVYLKITGTSRKSVELQQVKLPSAMFNGWQRVYLMSAYLEHTQLWALLTRNYFLLNRKLYTMKSFYSESQDRTVWYPEERKSKLRLLNSSLFPVSLTDCTETFIPNYHKRLAAFRKRYAKANIVSLMNGDLLSRDTLDSVLAINDKNYAKQQKRLSKIIDAITDENGKFTLDGKTTYVTRKLLLKRSKAHNLNDLDPKIRKLVEWYRSLKIVNREPVYAWLLRHAMRISTSWLTKQNALYVEREYNNGIQVLKQKIAQKPLVLLNVNEQDEVIHTDMKDGIELLPFECAGLNEFKDYQVVIFLAALRAKPAHAAFYRSQIPWYNPSDDYAVASAVQAITRGALRKTESDDKTLIIVADSTMAKAIHERLLSEPRLHKAQDYGVPDVVGFKFAFHGRKSKNVRLSDSQVMEEFKDSEKSRLKNLYNTTLKEVREKSPYYNKYRRQVYALSVLQKKYGVNPPKKIIQTLETYRLEIATLKQAHSAWAKKYRDEIRSKQALGVKQKLTKLARKGLEL